MMVKKLCNNCEVITQIKASRELLLTSLEKTSQETVTDYLIRAEKAITALRNAKETLSDGLIIAMILKGLPDTYKPFAIHVTQSASEITFAHFKSMLRSFEETEKFHAKPIVEQIMKAEAPLLQTVTCYGCGKTGHLVRDCPGKSVKTSKWCSYLKSTTHTDSTCKSQQKNKDQAKQVSEKVKDNKEEELTTDDFSGAVFVYFLKSKSDTSVATEKFLADVSPYGKVNCIRSDNVSELTGKAFQTLLRERGIKHEISAPYSPHQNGTAERHWRTLFEMGRCLILRSGLPKTIWPYAIQTAAHIRNRCYNRRTKTTPYFSLTGIVPDLSRMWIFGSECFAYEQEHKKLDSRCSKSVFVGYDKNSPSYLVYYLKNGKVMKHRLVKFVKNNSVEQYTQTDEFGEDSSVCERNDSDQWRSQPDNLVMLCKFEIIIIINFFRN